MKTDIWIQFHVISWQLHTKADPFSESVNGANREKKKERDKKILFSRAIGLNDTWNATVFSML